MKIIKLLLALFITFTFSCNTTEPPPPPDEKPTLELSLEDVSCIEAWIKLTTTNLQLPTTIILKQINPTGDTLSQVSILNTQDSLLYIDSLLPNKSYQYQVSSIEFQTSSNELNVTTMDTTSHDFTFETFTFGGDAGSCTLYDVAIINENYIIAVGTIFLTDSLGQPDPQPYGIAIWDGQNWELKKIFHGTNIPVTPRGILVISPNEIYLASGSIFRWDGISSTVVMVFSRLSLPDPNATIEKLWASSNSSIYGVGNVGSIVFFNGVQWSRIVSGTELNIGDIWGIADDNGDYNKYLAADNAMLKINAYNNLSRIDAETGMHLLSVWGSSNRLIYVVGGENDALYKNYQWEIINNPLVNTIYRIRGQNYNDVFGISSLGKILHFNGFSWSSINVPVENILLRLDVKGNVIASVGWQGEKAAITIIRRNN